MLRREHSKRVQVSLGLPCADCALWNEYMQIWVPLPGNFPGTTTQPRSRTWSPRGSGTHAEPTASALADYDRRPIGRTYIEAIAFTVGSGSDSG